jgi:signal recognition particle GTPase
MLPGAASDQIQTRADRLTIDIVNGRPGRGADSVADDAYQSSIAKKRHIFVIGIARQLHVKAKLDTDVQLHNWLVVNNSLRTHFTESG